MDNRVQDGNVITYANATGSAISSGDVVVMGNFCGVAVTDIANGASGSVAIEGVYQLTKKTLTEVVALGDIIADDSGPVVVASATDLVVASIIGRAVGASSSATATVNVKLGL